MEAGHREQSIMDAMAKAPGQEWSVDELAKLLYPVSRPKNWRNCITTTMLRIVTRQAKKKVRVMKTSGIGRGNVAKYALHVPTPAKGKGKEKAETKPTASKRSAKPRKGDKPKVTPAKPNFNPKIRRLRSEVHK